MCGSNSLRSSSRMRYERLAGAPPSSLRWWTYNTGVGSLFAIALDPMLGPKGMNGRHISESDAAGGAARTAYKVHRGLEEAGHVSRMLVGRKVTQDSGIRSIKRNDAWRAVDRAAGTLTNAVGLQYAYFPSSFAVARDPWFREAERGGEVGV